MHAAVNADLAPVSGLGTAELAAGLGAKVAGAALLDELTASWTWTRSCCSPRSPRSGAATPRGLRGGERLPGRAGSPAPPRGLPATSVAWGVWEAGPDRSDPNLPEAISLATLRRQGLTLLDPGRALTALGQVLADDETAVTVADVDWARFAPVFNAARPWRLLDEIPEARQQPPQPSAGTRAPAPRSRSNWPASRHPSGSGRCSTWSAPTRPRCSATPRRAGRSGRAFRDWASTR